MGASGPAAMAAISRMRSSESRLPVGLEGELMKIALVRAVIFSRMASGRYWKPSSSKTGTLTGTPCTNLMKLG